MSDASEDAADIAGNETHYDRLMKDISAVKNDIASLSQQVADAVNALAEMAQSQAKRGLKNARANVDSVVNDASGRVGTVAGVAQEAAASIGDTLEEAVQERPLATVAIALGLGFLIGVTWRR
jgi:ElaB/YqjD/DUF883 family membrane-anchored ribosome-binding protein